MECPKCHRKIPDNLKVCPHCHKVLELECPNCHNSGTNPVCENCGYIILTKCSKCGKTISSAQEKCKCGFPTNLSIAYTECESDEFASIIIKFSALKNIRRVLASKELFDKFYFRLRNLLISQIKSFDGKIITYNDRFVLNFNKELSFPTSVNKAIRLSIKIVNAFTDLNNRVINELGVPLKLNLTIVKKKAEDLLKENSVESNVKLLNVKKDEKPYLKGMQIILDQYVWDNINKEYKTDSLYSVEQDGTAIMFYEILLENYIIPPSEKLSDEQLEVAPKDIIKSAKKEAEDIYAFKVFDINAKCKFKKIPCANLIDSIDESKIISIRSKYDLGVQTSKLVEFYEAKGMNVLKVVCTEEVQYKPWGVFEQIFKEYYRLPLHNSFIPKDFDVKRFSAIKDMVLGQPRKAATPEDARFAYMEDFETFLKSLKNCVILIEGFEYMDDSSIQTLSLYFDKFTRLNLNFVFITESETSLHSKFKGLLRTPIYTEYVLTPTSIDFVLSTIKEEASDFIKSFYFEKIKENFQGSILYYKNAIEYLTEKDILINFENKLLIKNSNSIILPNDLKGLLKARLKHLSKEPEASMILAFSVYLGARIDYLTLEKLGIKEISKSVQTLVKKGFCYVKDEVIYINNYNLLKPVLELSIKKEVNEYLAKTILASIGKGLDDTLTLLLMGKLSMFKEEYLLLWKNSRFAMAVGDYDAYLKNCLGFLSLTEHIESNLKPEDIENNKKEVFENILMSLYSYSPEKIYSIENVLLMDAIKEDDNDKIVKLSNLMLQGALISSNYTDALNLLHNILTRMKNPTLIVDGAINTKFLLLSLINIEILFNIGDFAQCVDTAKDLLSVIKPEILNKIKPASFSVNLFVEHLFETLRLAGFAKLFLLDDDLEEFFLAIKTSLGEDLPEKDCILAIRDYLRGKEFAPSNVEEASAFSKVIYLILQEFSELEGDYKKFAQNIYQAKLLASDLRQTQLELICDLLIAYAYSKIGINKKAEIIYNDVLEKSENSAIFNTMTFAKYFIALLKLSDAKVEEALLIINDTLALLQKYNNQYKIMYALFENLFVKIVKEHEISAVNIDSEEQKLALLMEDGKLARIGESRV